MSEIALNIFSSYYTLQLYAKSVGYEYNPDDCDNNMLFRNLKNKRYFNTYSNYESTSVDFNDLKNGDIVSVSYCPVSQKYLFCDEYIEFTGQIFFIDSLNRDVLFYYDEYNKSTHTFIKTITSLKRPTCYNFGCNEECDYSLKRLDI